MKSTPSISAAIILAIALPPAPPTPMTVMRGRSSSTEGGPILMLINRSFQGSLIAGRADCHHSATKRIARAKGKSPYPQYASTCRALLQLSEIRPNGSEIVAQSLEQPHRKLSWPETRGRLLCRSHCPHVDRIFDCI